MADNGADLTEILKLGPELEIVNGHQMQLKDFGRIKSEEELQFEQIYLRESQILETLQFKLRLLKAELWYTHDCHARYLARIELHVEKARCQASLEHQTRKLVALQGLIDAGERDGDLLVARNLQDQDIKRSCITYKTRVVEMEMLVRTHEMMCEEGKEELESFRKIWTETGVDSL